MASTVTAMPSTRTSEAEWQTRLDLAACYRLVDLFGWSDLVNTRITARVPGQHAHFLINPYGLLFDEVAASSLVKIDAEGKKVEPSDSVINSGGFAIPSTIHIARPEVACVLHTPLGCRLRHIDAEGWAAAAQPGRLAGDRRRRLSRLRRRGPQPRRTSTPARRSWSSPHPGPAQPRFADRRHEHRRCLSRDLALVAVL